MDDSLRRWWIPLAAAVLVGAVACGLDTPGPSGSGGTGTPQDKPAADNVDACALLKAEEVTPLIGPNDGGKPSGEDDDDGGACEWFNPDTRSVITLDIGMSGTAASGKLPADEPGYPSEPGPDGMRFFAGATQFIVEDRVADIDVVGDEKKEAERATEVRLAKLVQSRF